MAVMYPPRSDAVSMLEELMDSADFGSLRAELLDGKLVVSPVATHWHERVVKWLERQLQEVCDANEWFASGRTGLALPPARERIIPDQLVMRGDAQVADDECWVAAGHVLLVAEVVSESSVHEDRDVKPLHCAMAGIPLYLLIDRYARPAAVTLCSEPGESGYAAAESVAVGGKLRLPEPFGVVLDTATMPVPRNPS